MRFIFALCTATAIHTVDVVNALPMMSPFAAGAASNAMMTSPFAAGAIGSSMASPFAPASNSHKTPFIAEPHSLLANPLADSPFAKPSSYSPSPFAVPQGGPQSPYVIPPSPFAAGSPIKQQSSDGRRHVIGQKSLTRSNSLKSSGSSSTSPSSTIKAISDKTGVFLGIEMNGKSFEVVKLLGQGYYGKAYLVQQGHEKLVVKVFSSGEQHRKMLHISNDNEIDALKKVGLFVGSGNMNGYGFLVMKLVPGTPFTHILEQHKCDPRRIPINQYVSATRKAYQQLEALGIAHMDIHIGNVLFTADDFCTGQGIVARFIDFGNSKQSTADLHKIDLKFIKNLIYRMQKEVDKVINGGSVA